MSILYGKEEYLMDIENIKTKINIKRKNEALRQEGNILNILRRNCTRLETHVNCLRKI